MNHCSSRLKLRLASARVMPVNGAQLGIDAQQQRNILLNRDREGINDVRRSPLSDHGFFRSESNIFLLHSRRGSRDFDSAGSRSFNSSARQSSDAANPHAPSTITRTLIPTHGIRRAAHLAILRGEGAALADNARIGIARAAHCGHIQSPAGNLLHAEIQIYHGDMEAQRT